ncbi:MAG: hypothetical protein ACLFQM_01085 [Fidelibacterota bacterium]
MKYKIIFIIIFIVQQLSAQEYLRLKTGIHFDSRVSGGKYSLEELAYIIGDSDLDVAIITDHDNMEVKYGPPFFRNAFHFKVKRNSVSKLGFRNYIDKINTLNKYYPDVEIIPGIEAVPYYSWQGNLLSGQLTLKNWHRHLLVFGFEDDSKFRELPSVKKGFPFTGSVISNIAGNFFYYIFMLLVFTLTIFLFLLIYRNRKITTVKAILLLVLIYLVIVEFPYVKTPITPYDPAMSEPAYQSFINYVKSNNGLVYWAHPESEYSENIKVPLPFINQTIEMDTDQYTDMVYTTRNHDGFAVFWEGMKVLGKPAGLWDMALTEYNSGARKKPFFVLGELDFEETNDLSLVNETNTFIFAHNRSREAIFDAFRKGRMYTTRNFLGNSLTISDFTAYNLKDETAAFIGEVLTVQQAPVAIHIQAETMDDTKDQVLTLYRNDEPIKQFTCNGSLDEWYVDKKYPKNKNFFYKLYGGKDWISLVTNPIFVKVK